MPSSFSIGLLGASLPCSLLATRSPPLILRLLFSQTLLATKQKELMANQQAMLAAEIERMRVAGEGEGFMAMASAVKNVTMQIKRETDKYGAELNRKHGNVFDATEVAHHAPPLHTNEPPPNHHTHLHSGRSTRLDSCRINHLI